MGDIGRNDPCPCGSGRKFKACCLSRRDRALPRHQPAPAPKFLFVHPGGMTDVLFSLPALLSANAQATSEWGRARGTWLTKPETAPLFHVLRAALPPELDLDVLEMGGNPRIPPSRETGGLPGWGSWPPEDWLRIVPGHQACVNATVRAAVPGHVHLTAWIAHLSGIDLSVRFPRLDAARVAELDPKAPTARVVFQPTCSVPERAPVDLLYGRLPQGTIVVRRKDDAGIPGDLIARYGYEEWVDVPMARVAATVAKARLVVGCATVFPVLAAMLGVPAVVAHGDTYPETHGVTPWGGLDLVGRNTAATLESLYQRILGERYVEEEEGVVPLVR